MPERAGSSGIQTVVRVVGSPRVPSDRMSRSDPRSSALHVAEDRPRGASGATPGANRCVNSRSKRRMFADHGSGPSAVGRIRSVRTPGEPRTRRARQPSHLALGGRSPRTACGGPECDTRRRLGPRFQDLEDDDPTSSWLTTHRESCENVGLRQRERRAEHRSGDAQRSAIGAGVRDQQDDARPPRVGHLEGRSTAEGLGIPPMTASQAR